jgi:DNA-binding NarL/FixJ family response regulator
VSAPKGKNEVPKEIVIGMASRGMTVPDIATKLGITEAKVRSAVEK